MTAPLRFGVIGPPPREQRRLATLRWRLREVLDLQTVIVVAPLAAREHCLGIFFTSGLRIDRARANAVKVSIFTDHRFVLNRLDSTDPLKLASHVFVSF